MSLSGAPSEDAVVAAPEVDGITPVPPPLEGETEGEPAVKVEDEIDEEALAAEEERRREILEIERENDPIFQAPHLQEGIPPVTCNFGKADYWDGRYFKNTETFEWYHDFQTLQELINRYCARDGKVLMLGCGNSRLTEEMYYDGYEEIESVDISRVVIDQMTDKVGPGGRALYAFLTAVLTSPCSLHTLSSHYPPPTTPVRRDRRPHLEAVRRLRYAVRGR
jgi:hypothetical protein